MKKYKILIWILLGLLLLLSAYTIYISNSKDKKIEEIEYTNEQNGKYTKLYYDNVINDLKKQNKSLYDSVKHQKDEIDFLLQFKYKKEFIIDTVFITKTDTIETLNGINEYIYSDTKNDTLTYTLSIGSEKEPSWYYLTIGVSDEFTIINKNYGDLNRIDIESSNNTNISDVIIVNKKEKYNPLKQISFGPSITGGYDIIHNRWGVIVGVSVTYNIIPRK